MAYVPEADKVVSEFRELIAYGRKFPDLGQALSDILYEGSPPFRADIDLAIPVSATDKKVVYQLVDRLKVLLAAGRARDRKSDNLPKRA